MTGRTLDYTAVASLIGTEAAEEVRFPAGKPPCWSPADDAPACAERVGKG